MKTPPRIALPRLLAWMSLALPALPASARPLFQEDFPTNTLSHYIHATEPHRGQFTDISAKTNGGSWSLVDTDPATDQVEYALQLVRAGNSAGAGITRKVDLDATAPGIICLRFDLAVVSQSEKANALIVEVGNLANTSSDYNVAVPAEDLFARLHVELKGDGTFKLKLGNNVSPTSFTFAPDSTKCPSDGTVATISYYLNKSPSTQYFRAPNGSYSYLSSGKCLVWIEWDDTTVSPAVRRAHLAVGACPPLIGANSDLNNFRLRWTANDSATWRLDNLRVENVLVPSMYGFPAERLVEAKARIADADPALMPAYNKLVAEAQAIDTAAEFPPRSVLDSNPTAYFPAGAAPSNRDYVSVGVYWWPPDATHSTWWQNDGHPNYDNENNTDSGDFKDVCDAITTLCWAYYLTPAIPANETLRNGYVQQVSALMNAWFLSTNSGMHPHLEHAGVIPFHELHGYGNPAGLIDSGRLIELSDSLALIGDSQHWTISSHLAWKNWIKDYRAWLLTPDGRGDKLMANPLGGSGNNNHTTWFDAQVAQYSLLVGDYRTARQKIKDAHLLKRLPYQSNSAGAQAHELARPASLDYSAYNATAMITLALQGQYFNYNWTLQTSTPSSPIAARSIRKVIDFFAPYASASPATATSTADWRVVDSDAPRNQGERLHPRTALALGASLWTGTDTYAAYWNHITPLLQPGANYTHTYNSVTTTYYYANERWNLFLPPAP